MKKSFCRQVTIDFNQVAILNCIIQDVTDADGIVPDGLVDEVDDEEESYCKDAELTTSLVPILEKNEDQDVEVDRLSEEE